MSADLGSHIHEQDDLAFEFHNNEEDISKEPTLILQVQENNDTDDETHGSYDNLNSPLLLGERDNQQERERGDVEMRIPLRLQRMKAAGNKTQAIHRPYFTIIISIIDIIVMIAEIIINKGFVSFKKNPWIGVSLDTLIEMGGKDTSLIITYYQWWRLITPVFLHVGIAHLALNLVAQLLLGFQLEKVLGTPRIIILYFVSAVAGNLVSALFLPLQLEAGASTAIYGLGSYYLVDLFVHWSLIIQPGRYFMGLMIGSILGLVFGLLPGIDNFAHIGGSAGGFLISLVLVPRTKEGRSLKYAKIATYLGPPLLLIFFGGGLSILFIPSLRAGVWRCHWCEYLNCLPIFHWCS